MNYDDDDGGLDTSQDGKYETPERTPVSTPKSNNRKIIDTTNSTIDLHDRVRGQNNGEVNNGEDNNGEEDIELGYDSDDDLVPGAYLSDNELDSDIELGGGRKKRRRKKSRKSRRISRRKSRKCKRKSRRSKRKGRKSRRKH
jgi:hypothetical protein